MARQTTILGLAKLDRKLKRLPTIVKSEIRTAMAAEAEKIIQMMRNLVAVDDGTLRDSIAWTWGKAPEGSFLVAKLKGAGVGGDLSITIYAGGEEAYYARWIEFGVNASNDLATKSKRADGQPFFFVSWRASRKGTKKEVRKAVRKSAKKVAAGG